MKLIPLSEKPAAILFQAFRALARKSWEQKMPVAIVTKRQHFYAGPPIVDQ
jgi:hypothetical protein